MIRLLILISCLTITDYAIADNIDTRYYITGGKLQAPVEIIFHHTGGPTVKGAIATLIKRGLSYHYIIDRDGTIYKLADANTIQYHAKGHNFRTIGISFVGGGKFGKVNVEQHKSAIKLVNTLKKEFPSITCFAGHKERSNSGKWDPDGLNYNYIERMIYGVRFCP